MRKSIVCFLAVFVTVAAILFSASYIEKHILDENAEKDGGNSASENYYSMRTIYFDGKPYTLRQNVETILLIGLDRDGVQKDSGSYNNDERADYLTLLIIDHTKSAYTLLPINRDTMTTYHRLGLNGEIVSDKYGQIALSYTYGNGLEISCKNTVDAVSYLLYDTEITHYCSMTMETVKLLNDIVGGVTVTFDRDYADVSSNYKKGVEYTFNRDEAMTFVRARSGLDEPTNLYRMERQMLYMNACLAQLKKLNMQKDEVLTHYDEISPYIVTDCDKTTIAILFDNIRLYQFAGVEEIAGFTTNGETYVEFYADDKDLKKTVLKYFYSEVYLTAEND